MSSYIRYGAAPMGLGGLSHHRKARSHSRSRTPSKRSRSITPRKYKKARSHSRSRSSTPSTSESMFRQFRAAPMMRRLSGLRRRSLSSSGSKGGSHAQRVRAGKLGAEARWGGLTGRRMSAHRRLSAHRRTPSKSRSRSRSQGGSHAQHVKAGKLGAEA